MRLADFILAHIEPILVDWEAFAHSITPDLKMNRLALRDHAADILRATAIDMVSSQTAGDRHDKSQGNGVANESISLNTASDIHAIGRVDSGFDLLEVVAEYRALRASVILLWSKSGHQPESRDLDDLTRFNESIDQSLTTAIQSYTTRVERSRQMFLAILGHDLRGPLNAMMMSAELLKRTGHLDPDSTESAQMISSSASVMARMITDILDFTSATLGSAMPVTPAPMDLTSLCNDTIEETRASAPNRQIRFTPQGNLRGKWDTDRLRQLLANLLGNAVQHGKGPIHLTADGRDDHVTLSVHNDGAPIPPNVLPTLFDPLVRGTPDEPAKQRRHGSIGLGLYIAKQIATAHGGTLDATSSPSDGTRFTAHLPRNSPPLNKTDRASALKSATIPST